MDYGISGLSIIPVRKEPSEKSEMISQILFGEYFEIKEEFVGWCRIISGYDGYEGWIDQKMITIITSRTYKKIKKSSVAVSTDIVNLVSSNKCHNVIIPAGSTLPCWRPYKHEFSINKEIYKMDGNIHYRQPKNIRRFIIQQSLMYINSPYLWGGRSPLGIDCSGFSQIVYKMAGIIIPRDASQQVHLGTALSFVDEASPGDLAFFDNEKGDIVHVGILWKENKIIHSSGQVRIDNIDEFGIFNVDKQAYTHKLRVMKRIIEN